MMSLWGVPNQKSEELKRPKMKRFDVAHGICQTGSKER